MKIKPILQLTKTECGICCLSMLARYYGYSMPIKYYREKVDIGRDGVSVDSIAFILREINFDVNYSRLNDFGYNEKNNFPVIVHTKSNHYIIWESYNKQTNNVIIVDPAIGRVKFSITELINLSSGLIICAYPNENFEKRKEKESVWKPLLFLAKSVNSKFIVALLLSILTYFFSLTIPLLIQMFIDRLNMNVVIFKDSDLLLAICSLVLFLFLSYCRNKVIVSMELVIDKNLLMELMEHILRLPYKYFETRSTGEIIFRINLLNSIRLLISEGLIRGIIDAGSVLFILAYMFCLSHNMVIVVILILVGIFLLASAISNRVVVLNKSELAELAQISNLETETVEMIFDIKCLGVETLFLNRLKEQYQQFQNKFKIRELLSRCIVSLLQFFQLFIPFLLLLVNLYYINETQLSIGMVVAFYTLSNMVITNCIALVQEVTNFRLMKNYILRINDILCEDVETNNHYKINEFKNLSIKNISFKYSENSPILLNGINIHIAKGQKIAIVGESGSGKSTIVKLLLGLYEPMMGNVQFNGINMEDLDKNQLKKIIGVMPQDAKLFNGSIKYNITLGDNSISEDVIINALKKANIYDDIKKMPLGLQTVISSGGRNLSGGQRQRIGLARILVLQPQLIILDEATSSLDGINEKEIMTVLNSYKCTQVIVSHRFSTIMNADYVYLIKNGKVADEGGVKDLIKKHGEFYTLFSKQIETNAPLYERSE